MLVLLAVVVVAGVALRMVDDRRRDADQAADRRAEAREEAREDAAAADDASEPAVDDPAPEPDEPAGDATGSGSAAIDDPLGIALVTSTGVNGEQALNVDQIGPVKLGGSSTLPYVTSVLGQPDNSGPNAQDANVCDGTWVTWGLEARFYFGHPPTPEASCTKGPVAAALMTGERWFVQPLTGGGRVIGVGDPVNAIATAFPNSRVERLSAGLATLAQSSDGHLIAEGSYGGDPYPTLYAIGVDGSIASFLYVSGAD